VTRGRSPALLPLLAAVLVVLAVLACSDFVDQGGGVIALEIQQPAVDSLDVGDTLRLHARALDKNGDSIPADIRWVTTDTSLAVDSVTGLVTGLAPCSACGVRAHEGTLYTSPVTLRVLPRPDSLVVGAQTLTVAAESLGSPPLEARLLSGTPPTTGVAGRRLVYTVVDPAFPDPAQRTVELLPGAVVDTALTGIDGAPTTPVVLSRIAGVAPPESVVVEVGAQRLSGTPVPGTGQRFTVRFQP
jgi:hypothetical protein